MTSIDIGTIVRHIPRALNSRWTVYEGEGSIGPPDFTVGIVLHKKSGKDSFLVSGAGLDRPTWYDSSELEVLNE